MTDSLLHPEVHGLHDLNELAQGMGWELCADGDGQFYLPETQRICAIWHDKAVAGIPRRADMTARLLKPYLRLISIHERIAEPGGGRRYRMRLMGQTLADDFGEATGKLYEEFLSAHRLRVWNAMSDTVLQFGGPVRFLLRSDEIRMTGELLAAPLRSADGRADLILSARRFNRTWKWDELVSHWQQERRMRGTDAGRS
jgi:PAS domain